MKRLFSALLILVAIFTLTACKADNAAKYIGTWSDETGNVVVVLNEDGTASVRIDDVIYEASATTWKAKGYDKVSIWTNVVEEESEEVPETEISDAQPDGEEVVNEDDIATAAEEEEPEAENTPESENDAEGAPEAETKVPTQTQQKTVKVLIGEFSLTISDGVMYLLSSNKETAMASAALIKQ